MYSPPWYVWVICLVGAIGFPAAACLTLYRGARGTGSSRARAAVLSVTAGVVLGGWLAGSAVIAARGHYQGAPGELPWLGIAAGGSLVALLAMSRFPAVARALAAPESLSRSVLPHAFRVAGVSFPIVMALGHLSPLFAIPAGLGDMAIGIWAPFVALQLARGAGRRGAVWFHALGTLDLVNALILGGLTGYGIVHTASPNDALAALPIVLIPSAGVPLLLALHIVSLRRLIPRRVATPVTAPLDGSQRSPQTPLPEGTKHVRVR
jgi:hypothetical protein